MSLHSNSYHLLFEQLLPKLFYLSSLLLALKSKLFLAQPLDIGMEPIEKELMIGTSKLVLASFKTNLKKNVIFFFMRHESFVVGLLAGFLLAVPAM